MFLSNVLSQVFIVKCYSKSLLLCCWYSLFFILFKNSLFSNMFRIAVNKIYANISNPQKVFPYPSCYSSSSPLPLSCGSKCTGNRLYRCLLLMFCSFGSYNSQVKREKCREIRNNQSPSAVCHH